MNKTPLPAPFISESIMKRLNPTLNKLSYTICSHMPNLAIDLKKAAYTINDKEYMNRWILSLALIVVILFLPLTAIILSTFEPKQAYAALFMTYFTGFIFVFRGLFRPKLIAEYRKKDIEKNLIPVLKIFYIQLKSGSQLYDIIDYISKKDFGIISEEFTKVRNNIAKNIPFNTSIRAMIENTNSRLFKRAMILIINGTESGADNIALIKEHINRLSNQQKEQIRFFGSKLNPITLGYMLIIGIFPTLAITFIIAASTINLIDELYVRVIFYGIWMFTVIMQFMIMGIIKSSKPALLRE